VASKLARFSWLPGGLAATVVLVVGRLLTADATASLEASAYDRMQRSTAVRPARDIVIIDVDAASIAQLGEWPWPRDVHASLIEQLTADGARVVAFTVPFGSAQDTKDMDRVRQSLTALERSGRGDSQQARQLRALLNTSRRGLDAETHLTSAISAHGNVVLPIELRIAREPDETAEVPRRFLIPVNDAVLDAAAGATGIRPPVATFSDAAAAAGHMYLPADADGIVRSDLAGVQVGKDLIPSLAVAVAARSGAGEPAELRFARADELRLGTHSVPLSSQLRILPRYLPPPELPGDAATFRHYSYWNVLTGGVPAAEMAGKTVLIGLTDTRTADATSVQTPVAALTPPVTAIASTVSSLQTGTVYSRPGFAIGIELLVALIVVVFAALALPALGLTLGTIASLLIVGMLAVTEVGLLASLKVWAQLALPGLATLAGLIMYLLGETIRRANVGAGGGSRDSAASLRALGQTFQKQGQLDLAFETYRRAPLDAATMELLYHLGVDFERRRQGHKAGTVYSYIAARDPNYRDLKLRRARVAENAAAHDTDPSITHSPHTGGAQAQRPDAIEAEQPKTRTLGRYEIERELGKGAMGVVYLGRDPKINRVVAIKAIPLAEEFEEDDLVEARARFFREAEMAGRLNHPSIVTVYDAGEDGGLAYIAMEYLRGQHLSHFTDAARLLPPGTVMSLVARVAEALHYAHRQNVVHRDIKPANIMFNPDTDELKITDFGIARLTDTSRTKTGIVLGTPSFMSPEQLEGRGLDGRSDQFALGVSLYQLLCGQLPFRADSMPRLMQKIATEPHTPLRLVRPELPDTLEPIIDRVLSKSADDRYANCAEFAAALRQCAKALEAERPAHSEHEWLIP
jgi:serine/threonine-protein kinase